MYDIVGDIHGHADELELLLTALGYQEQDGCYQHNSRKLLFLGDFIDRGPKIARVLQIAQSMVEEGHALAILGNHELNALAYHTPHPDRSGEFLRPHLPKNIRQHRHTIGQLAPSELASALKWFRTLPCWLDLSGLRAVHACWHVPAMAVIQNCMERYGGITSPFLQAAYDEGDPLFAAVETVLKGPETTLPPGIGFTDKDGQHRDTMRTRWYLSPAQQTYRTYGWQADTFDCDHPLPAELHDRAHFYPTDAKPVFVGHYWQRAERPQLLAANVACLDYSVARGGLLVAYRWNGEAVLDESKFVFVSATPPIS